MPEDNYLITRSGCGFLGALGGTALALLCAAGINYCNVGDPYPTDSSMSKRFRPHAAHVEQPKKIDGTNYHVLRIEQENAPQDTYMLSPVELSPERPSTPAIPGVPLGTNYRALDAIVETFQTKAEEELGLRKKD